MTLNRIAVPTGRAIANDAVIGKHPLVAVRWMQDVCQHPMANGALAAAVRQRPINVYPRCSNWKIANNIGEQLLNNRSLVESRPPGASATHRRCGYA